MNSRMRPFSRWDANRVSMAVVIMVVTISEFFLDTKFFWMGRGYMELGNPGWTVFMIISLQLGGLIVPVLLILVRQRVALSIITSPYAVLALVHAMVCFAGVLVSVDAQMAYLALNHLNLFLLLQGVVFLGLVIWIGWSVILGNVCDGRLNQ